MDVKCWYQIENKNPGMPFLLSKVKYILMDSFEWFLIYCFATNYKGIISMCHVSCCFNAKTMLFNPKRETRDVKPIIKTHQDFYDRT